MTFALPRYQIRDENGTVWRYGPNVGPAPGYFYDDLDLAISDARGANTPGGVAYVIVQVIYAD